MKKCPPGEYYCHDMKKCKKIPSGYHVGARGYLEQDDNSGKRMVTETEPMVMDIQMEMALMEMAVA